MQALLCQDLEREHGIRVSLRTVERAVRPWRQELAAEMRATLRFQTPPGRQLQIDFGETRVPIGGERARVYLIVATLGYSRRRYMCRRSGTSGSRPGSTGSLPGPVPDVV